MSPLHPGYRRPSSSLYGCEDRPRAAGGWGRTRPPPSGAAAQLSRGQTPGTASDRLPGYSPTGPTTAEQEKAKRKASRAAHQIGAIKAAAGVGLVVAGIVGTPFTAGGSTPLIAAGSTMAIQGAAETQQG